MSKIIEFTEGGSAVAVAFRRRGPSRKYQDFVDAASRLRHKQHIVLEVPRSRGLEPYRTCIRQALSRYTTEETAAVKRFEVRVFSVNGEDKIGVVAFCHNVENQ